MAVDANASAPPELVPPDILTVLRDSRRDAFVAEARSRPPFFEPISKSWIVAQPELCRELLASAEAPVVLLGRGALAAGAVAEIGELGRSLGAVFGTTVGGKGALESAGASTAEAADNAATHRAAPTRLRLTIFMW